MRRCKCAPRNPENTHGQISFYWQYKGKPVMLLGGTDDDNLFQWTGTRLTEQLDLLKTMGGNYVRNTMSSRDPDNLWPYEKTAGKYDLNRWNEEYWRRFDTFLAETARRDIIVQIEVWATWDFYGEQWEANPFNPKNFDVGFAKDHELIAFARVLQVVGHVEVGVHANFPPLAMDLDCPIWELAHSR